MTKGRVMSNVLRCYSIVISVVLISITSCSSTNLGEQEDIIIVREQFLPPSEVLIKAEGLCGSVIYEAVAITTAFSPPILPMRAQNTDEQELQWSVYSGEIPGKPPMLGELIDVHEGGKSTPSLDVSNFNTLVCIKEELEQVGSYNFGEKAYKYYWDVVIVEWTSGEVIAYERFEGSDPPESTTRGIDGYGSIPDNQFLVWYRELALQ